jgi:hypothetical protein
MSEWISVKDRLPENGVEVWVWLGNQKELDFPGQSRMTTAVFSVTQWFGTRMGEDILGDVTHWQPCPVSPESEEEMSEKLPPEFIAELRREIAASNGETYIDSPAFLAALDEIERLRAALEVSDRLKNRLCDLAGAPNDTMEAINRLTYRSGNCNWTPDEGYDTTWINTSCGESMLFDDGYDDGAYKYCPYCGRKVHYIQCKGGEA